MVGKSKPQKSAIEILKMNICEIPGVEKKGRGYSINLDDLKKIFRSADVGDENAQYQLGELHYHEVWVDGYHRECDESKRRRMRYKTEEYWCWVGQLVFGEFADNEGETYERMPKHEALEWYCWAAKNGHVDALRMREAMCRDEIKMTQCHIPTLKLLSEAGIPDAQYELGVRYVKEEYYTRAFECFSKAAEQGDAKAQEGLGELYYKGLGVEQNYTEAFKWFSKAYKQGNTKAQTFLAQMYYNGEGVEQNYVEAFKRFSKAAKQGDLEAQHYLGAMYFKGEGIEQNYAEAFKWISKAAEAGHSGAQSNLGNMYYEGEGVEQNYAEALKWYEKAADQGNGFAMYQLGVMYRNGEGTYKNYNEAFRWFRDLTGVRYYNFSVWLEKYPVLHDTICDAAYNIGEMYRNGEGVTQNYNTALEWYSKAAEAGHEKAQKAIKEIEHQKEQIKSQEELKTAAIIFAIVAGILGLFIFIWAL